ncbi:UNVERIFIED_CONTAM: hypothetical protein FKN15_011004 [Acipenser sinensis]
MEEAQEDKSKSAYSERVYRPRLTYLELPEDKVIRSFRLNTQEILNLCEELAQDLESPTKHSRAIPVAVKVAAALRCYASGGFQKLIGDICDVSQTSMSKMVTEVTDALVKKAGKYMFSKNSTPTTASEIILI